MDYFRDLLVSDVNESNVILTGIPYDEGCSVGKGASLAPLKIKELSSFLPPLSMDGDLLTSLKLFDNGNIEVCENYFDVLYKKASEVFNYNKFPIFIGGDHSITIPLQQAFYDHCKENNKTPVIIHLDAHPDICDFYDDSKYSHACTNKRSIDYGYEKENVVMVGIRGFEEQESNEILHQLSISFICTSLSSTEEPIIELSNALPIAVTLLGIVMLVRLKQSSKASS